MPILKEQIARYLAGNCQEEEHQRIAAHLQQHPEELEQFLDEQGWGAEMTIPEEQSFRMLAGIQRKTGKIRKGIIWTSVAAAAIAGALALGWYTYEREVPPAALPVAQVPVIQQRPAFNEVGVFQQADSVVLLPDGSRATLRRNTVIRYDTAFDRGNRALHLQGEAVFDVVKRAALPFTVYSGQVSTTALGTVFMVSAWKHTHQVKVRLMSGKVVVKTNGQRSTYLRPGQELAWNEEQQDMNVYVYGQKPKLPVVKATVAGTTVHITDGHIEFVKCPVEEVFSVLRKEYGITITANAADLKGCFFSGALSGPGEVNDIIETIATLNQLAVMQDETGYHISK